MHINSRFCVPLGSSTADASASKGLVEAAKTVTGFDGKKLESNGEQSLILLPFYLSVWGSQKIANALWGGHHDFPLHTSCSLRYTPSSRCYRSVDLISTDPAETGLSQLQQPPAG